MYSPSNYGDQSSSPRTSWPERRNGSARASRVYAIPSPSTAARTAKSVSLTITRPFTEIRRDLRLRSNSHISLSGRQQRRMRSDRQGQHGSFLNSSQRRTQRIYYFHLRSFSPSFSRLALIGRASNLPTSVRCNDVSRRSHP